jgi:hypothetical protein
MLTTRPLVAVTGRAQLDRLPGTPRAARRRGPARSVLMLSAMLLVPGCVVLRRVRLVDESDTPAALALAISMSLAADAVRLVNRDDAEEPVSEPKPDGSSL